MMLVRSTDNRVDVPRSRTLPRRALRTVMTAMIFQSPCDDTLPSKPWSQASQSALVFWDAQAVCLTEVACSSTPTPTTPRLSSTTLLAAPSASVIGDELDRVPWTWWYSTHLRSAASPTTSTTTLRDTRLSTHSHTSKTFHSRTAT